MIGKQLLFVIALGAAASLHAQPAAQTVGKVTAGQVDALFAKWDRPDSPGCALAVLQGGRIVYKRGYGMADLSHDVKITTTTPFHVASVSKQFTAAAIVLLAGQGKLSLEDNIRKFVPGLHDFGHTITLRHLLQNTSGLRDQWDLLTLAGYRYSHDLITDEDVMNLVLRQKELNFPPGSEYSYSNSGFTLAGQIVKRVTGQSLREFTTRHLFEPLGMKRTHFRDDHTEINKGEALGYVAGKDGSYRLSVTNFDTVGATSLYTTVEDLSKWDANFYSPKVGGADFAQRMTRIDKLTSGKSSKYAMGLIVDEYRGLPIVEHAGGDAGYRSHLMRFPEQRFSVACLCNTVVDAAELARKVSDLYLAARFTQPAPAVSTDTEPVKLPDGQAAAKAGYYRARGPGVLIKLSAENGMLHLVSRGEKKPMRLGSKGELMLPDTGYSVRFEPASGRAQRLRLEANESFPEIWDRVPAFSLASGAAREFAGAYYSQELDTIYRLEAVGDKLVLKRKKYPDDALEPIAPDLFANPTLAWTVAAPVQFVRDAKGVVTGMTVTTGRSRALKFKRQPG